MKNTKQHKLNVKNMTSGITEFDRDAAVIEPENISGLFIVM